jgi:arylsulfatase A-like enzyme
VITEKAIDFIKQGPANLPFCLTVAFLEPHGPYDYFDPAIPDRFGGVSIPVPSTLTRGAFDIQPKYIRESLAGSEGQAWLGNSETYRNRVRIVYRLIERADAAVGQIMESLRRQGLDGNTVVIFASDNGNLRGAHGLTGKWLMYEESIRVPLIVRDPRLPASRRGLVSEEMALNIDLAPTVLAFAGVPIPQEMQGRDLGPLIRGEPQAWRQDWYYEHTLQTPPSYSIPKSEGVRTKEWKYIRYTDFSPPVEQLFNLSSDPREMSDLSGYAEHFGVLVRLRSRCDELREQLR